MKSLNDLIWNTDEDFDIQNQGRALKGDMLQICIGITAFCGDNGYTGSTTNGYACIIDAPERTSCCKAS